MPPEDVRLSQRAAHETMQMAEEAQRLVANAEALVNAKADTEMRSHLSEGL